MFVIRRSVRFSETDMAGVMHFSNYMRWMEDAEHAFWRALGLGVHMPDEAGAISWPRAAASCEYRAPARFEEEIELRVAVERIGGKSLVLVIDFHRDAQHIARGRMTTVCCRLSAEGFTSIEIPAPIRSALEQFAAQASPGGPA